MMAKLYMKLTLLVIFISLMSILDQVEPSSLPESAKTNTMTFIKASCKNTLYENLCIHSLSKFSSPTIDNPQQLAHIALSVSLSKARNTRTYLNKVANQLKALKNNKDYFIVQDCLSQIDDSVDQLDQSIKELARMSRPNTPEAINDEFLWHISNVETWVSTALTDASTCVESFPGHRMSKLKASIRVRAQNVAQVTSNALALFHGYGIQLSTKQLQHLES